MTQQHKQAVSSLSQRAMYKLRISGEPLDSRFEPQNHPTDLGREFREFRHPFWFKPWNSALDIEKRHGLSLEEIKENSKNKREIQIAQLVSYLPCIWPTHVRSVAYGSPNMARSKSECRTRSNFWAWLDVFAPTIQKRVGSCFFKWPLTSGQT